jgi:PHD/YefM family antitoxin component YafN of YafNO toxin-antitoxin module
MDRHTEASQNSKALVSRVQMTCAQARPPAVVVMSVEDLESLQGMLDVMDSADLLTDIRQSLADVASGGAEVLSKEQAQQLISPR